MLWIDIDIDGGRMEGCLGYMNAGLHRMLLDGQMDARSDGRAAAGQSTVISAALAGGNGGEVEVMGGSAPYCVVPTVGMGGVT